MEKFKLSTSQDGTQLVTFTNGMKSVIIPAKNGKITFCLSTQLGCQMGCVCCRAGEFKRNLTDLEILEQFKVAKDIVKQKPTAIVFMGMGEPMLNFKHVDSAIHSLNRQFGISFRNITLSTCGVNLDKLQKVRYHVAVSLHSARDEVRKNIVKGTASVAEILEFTKVYLAKNGHGVMLELTLIDGVNDSDADLKALLGIVWPKNVSFNLISLNPFNNLLPSKNIEAWRQSIIDAGYKCVIREAKGSDIEAACGMLDC